MRANAPVLAPAIRGIKKAALLASGALAMTAVMVAPPSARAQKAIAPYTLTAFPGTPPAGATQPDDLAISADGTSLWVGYGNGVDTFGKGSPSTVVEYDIATGALLKSISIPGHVDGLKINPTTGHVWATENEDGNPTLAVIDRAHGSFKIYRFAPGLITGGFDDLVFVTPKGALRNDPDSSPNVFVVSSSQVSTTKPTIVQICGPLKATNTCLTPALPGAPVSVWNVVTNKEETTDTVGDPDSMTLDPAGELVLDNRSDLSLYIVRDPKAQNPVLRVPLTIEGKPVEVNDTIFTASETTGIASTAGTIFITDTTANKIYMLTKPYFPANEVYTAANVANVVGLVDLNTGVVTPIATGFKGVHGLALVPTSVTLARPDSEKSEGGDDDQ